MFTGDISDFSLRDILQFLTSISRSGVLQIRSGASTAGIALADGGVCFALLDTARVGGLGVRLALGGALDAEHVRRIAGHGGGDAIAAAIALAVQSADAADLYLEHMYEALGWLTRLDDASFSFGPDERLADWPFAAAAADDVFAEVDARAERWSQLSEAVGDMMSVCGLLPDAAASTDVVLTAEQWRVVTLVDGRRAVGDLVELTGIGHLETCAQLDQLVEQGVVEVVAPGEPTTLTATLGGLGVEPEPTTVTPAADPLPLTEMPTATDATDPEQAADDVPAVANDEDVNQALLTRLLKRPVTAP